MSVTIWIVRTTILSFAGEYITFFKRECKVAVCFFTAVFVGFGKSVYFKFHIFSGYIENLVTIQKNDNSIFLLYNY